MRASKRVLLTTLSDPRPRGVRVDRAVHDPKARKHAQRFQPRPPHPILEGRLRHRCDTGAKQQLQHAEEGRQRPHRQLVTRRGCELAGGVHHPFLDLIAADRRTPDGAGKGVGKRGLPGAGRSAYHDQSGTSDHRTVITRPSPTSCTHARRGGAGTPGGAVGQEPSRACRAECEPNPLRRIRSERPNRFGAEHWTYQGRSWRQRPPFAGRRDGGAVTP